MTKIKFGTDGWRAIIAQEYTVDNVKRVAEATAKWLQERNGSSIVLGYDCRFAGKLFAETTARVMGAHGIKVYFGEEFASTPMVSLGVVKLDADLGVVITASHNPPSYNGFKLKSKLGGPMIPAEVSEVEDLIPDQSTLELASMDDYRGQGLIESVDLEKIYLDHVSANFDLAAIQNSGIKVAYDAMYGAGQNAMRKLLPNAVLLHCEYNPSFMGQAPEPIHRNLGELSQTIADDPSIQVGIANDGDADRIGMYDEDGKFVDSHHILLLLLLYMHQYKGHGGKVIVTFSVTEKMRKLAEHYGLEVEVTKIGFKYIAEIMAKEDVIVGGEESGGLAVKGHIPERDGVWIGLLILEFMAKTGKSLKGLIQEVYDIVGGFAFDRDDLHIADDKKWAIIERAK
ncbi:MAG: phosphoglucomutase/phosphomannomutase family protein, partial [Bacteroidota bacterium]